MDTGLMLRQNDTDGRRGDDVLPSSGDHKPVRKKPKLSSTTIHSTGTHLLMFEISHIVNMLQCRSEFYLVRRKT